MHHATKEAWEELHWDQDVGRWIGARRDEMPRQHRQLDTRLLAGLLD